uniref:Uncharacterized protein n=1 Tax=viral metagenome TaxID=1070528 RepID=A0A6M3IMU0_9ZZZZ
MPKFKGTFNYYCELIILWNHAKDISESKRFFIIELAKRLGKTTGSIRRYFNGAKDNFKIKEIKNEKTLA